MFGLHSLILNLFTWLIFLFPQDYLGNKEVLSASAEEVISSWQNPSPAIIELSSFFNQLIEIASDTELPFTKPCDKIHYATVVAFEPKLLYFQIGNAIELQLSSTTIIFPFHCFT